MKTYRVGLVGLSGIASVPASPGFDGALGSQMPHSHTSALALLRNVEVVAGCDIVPAMFERLEPWKATWPNVATYTDHREMLAREKPDVITVATSDHRHAQIVVDACEAGVKGIFCEKPLATTIADADRMIAAVEKHGVVMTIDHWTRWSPYHRLAWDAIKAGRIGRVKRIVETGGGPRAMLFRNGTYSMDTIAMFADADPVLVFAELDEEFKDYPPRYAGDGGKSPKTDPGASSYIRFANGVRGYYNFSQGTVTFYETFVQGEKGWIRFSSAGLPFDLAVADEKGVLQHQFLASQQYTHTGLAAAMRELFHVLEHGGAVSSPPQQARRSVELMLATLQSSASGQPVTLPVNDA